MLRHTRSISTIPPRRSSSSAHRSSSFFTPPPPPRPGASGEDPEDLEAEVNDREWEMRVARGMMHLRETSPSLFDPGVSSRDLFPKDVYSRNVNLKSPHPLGSRSPGLHAYGLAFTIARNGLQASHHDCGATSERSSYSPHSSLQTKQPGDSSPPDKRMRQIRVMLTIHGTPRSPPHKVAVWHTSNLYTFSPYSGSIAEHEVEAIRPSPGEGVMEWIQGAMGGWTKNGTPVPGTVRTVRASAHEHRRR